MPHLVAQDAQPATGILWDAVRLAFLQEDAVAHLDARALDDKALEIVGRVPEQPLRSHRAVAVADESTRLGRNSARSDGSIGRFRSDGFAGCISWRANGQHAVKT